MFDFASLVSVCFVVSAYPFVVISASFEASQLANHLWSQMEYLERKWKLKSDEDYSFYLNLGELLGSIPMKTQG